MEGDQNWMMNVHIPFDSIQRPARSLDMARGPWRWTVAGAMDWKILLFKSILSMKLRAFQLHPPLIPWDYNLHPIMLMLINGCAAASPRSIDRTFLN